MKSVALLRDPALPGLVQALNPEAMTPRLVSLACILEGKEWTAAPIHSVVEVEILKHTPGRRCALGYTLDGPVGKRRLFGKIFSGERGPSTFEELGKISAAIPRENLLVPRPAGHFLDLRLLVTEYMEGRPLAPSLYEGMSDAPARHAAAAIAVLHSCEARLARCWSTPRELDNTDEWLSRSPVGSPASSGRAKTLLHLLRGRATRLPDAKKVPVHRDFYAEQVHDCGGRTTLLDLDDARLGDPALDVGNFLAHLKLRSLQFPHLAHGCLRARPAFLDEYRRRRQGSNGMVFAQRVAFYEAASLLRLSGVYCLRQRWLEILPEKLLNACEAVLDGRG